MAYAQLQGLGTLVEKALLDLSKYNPKLFDKIENLKDPLGNEITVFVESVPNLSSNAVSDNGIFQYSVSKPLNGNTSVSPLQRTILTDATTGSTKSVWTVGSNRGANTVIISLDAD